MLGILGLEAIFVQLNKVMNFKKKDVYKYQQTSFKKYIINSKTSFSVFSQHLK